jgi:hypothetical protein
MNPSVLRGRLLRLAAMRARSSAECTDRSVPLGRWRMPDYRRISAASAQLPPLVPRSPGNVPESIGPG